MLRCHYHITHYISRSNKQWQWSSSLLPPRALITMQLQCCYCCFGRACCHAEYMEDHLSVLLCTTISDAIGDHACAEFTEVTSVQRSKRHRASTTRSWDILGLNYQMPGTAGSGLEPLCSFVCTLESLKNATEP